jgi:hypothetical protein
VAIFPCFASSFDFFNNPAVLTTATMITDFRARVTGQVPAWTEPVANTFKSPVDGVGRFFEVILTPTTATRLRWTIVDQNAITVADREIDISGIGTSVNYYTGQFHAFIEALEATPELAQSGILDETPLAQNAILDYVYGNGYRNAGSGIDGAGSNVNEQFMLDNGASANQNRFRGWGQAVAGSIGLKDSTGALQFFPADMFVVIGGVAAWVGRAYQVYLCDASLPFGTSKTIRIGDAGETGIFTVVGLVTTQGVRQMLRTA